MEQKVCDASGETGWLALVKGMAEDGDDILDPVAPTELGSTILHATCERGYYETVKYLLENYNIDIETAEEGRDRNTALHCACKGQGDLETVRYLVHVSKANIHAWNSKKWTPLHLACYRGHWDVVRFLVEECNANVNAVADRNLRPLSCAVLSCDNRSDDVIQYIAPLCAVDDKVLRLAWGKDLSNASKRSLLQGYARTTFLKHHRRGQSSLSESYVEAYPMHAVLQSRLPFAAMYRDCVNVCFPKAYLATVDDQGRLPLHLAVKETIGSAGGCLPLLLREYSSWSRVGHP